MRDPKPFTSKEMAEILENKKLLNSPVVLILGGRSGALYRSSLFFELVQKFCDPDFSKLPRFEQFGHLLSRFTQEYFSPSDIHHILRTSFEKSKITEADYCLAELIKQGHFEEIIYTGYDDGVEIALNHVEMQENWDFEVKFSYRNLFEPTRIPIRLIKVFGDFPKRDYDSLREIKKSDADHEHYIALQRILAGDLLVVGTDEKWDKHLLEAIPWEGKVGKIWFVNEDEHAVEKIDAYIHQRPYFCLSGREGQYSNFMKDLYYQLYRVAPFNIQLGRDILDKLDKLSEQIAKLFQYVSTEPPSWQKKSEANQNDSKEVDEPPVA